MRQGRSICFLIPAFNEAKNLEKLVGKLWQVTSEIRHNFEILFVDDGSRDDTWKVIEKLGAKDRRIQGISLSRNFGKENALLSGVECIGDHVDAVIVLDADLQHPPTLIPQMIKSWENADIQIVEAIKKSRGEESWSYKISSRLFYYLIFRLGGFELGNSSDFKLLDRVVIEQLKKMPEANVFFRGMISWVGFSTLKLFFDVAPRADANGGMSFRKRFKLALTAIMAFTSAPLQIVSVIAFSFFMFALAMTGHTLYRKFTGTATSGFATVNILLLLVGSSVLFGLGIIGEYIAKIYAEVKGRPRYIVSRSKNLDSGIKIYRGAGNE